MLFVVIYIVLISMIILLKPLALISVKYIIIRSCSEEENPVSFESYFHNE